MSQLSQPNPPLNPHKLPPPPPHMKPPKQKASPLSESENQRSHNMQFGRCFEEFEIGAVYKHWPGRTITEYDDTLFCMLTMNHNPLHIDANYAEETQHRQRLVAGPLIFSIALGMSVGDVSGKAIANLEFEYVKHLAPTFHGDTI